MYRMLLADDHVLFREGMRTLTGHWQDIQVVGEACNGEEAVALCRELLPDIVLMDITMPVLDGIQATWQITRECPGTRVVMLTVSDDDDDLFEAIRHGASGYVLKSMPSRRLHDELRGVLHGEAPLSSLMAAKILREFNQLREAHDAPAIDAPAASVVSLARRLDLPTDPDQEPAHRPAERMPQVEPLTGREREVLQWLAEGLSNVEIADRLCLSENTVKKHLHNVLTKLHLNNRVAAALYAVREGIAVRQL